MQYYLNLWQSTSSNGSSLIFRTDDKVEFYNFIKLITEKYKPYKNLFKVTKYSNKTVVSFCDNGSVFSTWYQAIPTGKVDSIETVKLDNLMMSL